MVLGGLSPRVSLPHAWPTLPALPFNFLSFSVQTADRGFAEATESSCGIQIAISETINFWKTVLDKFISLI